MCCGEEEVLDLPPAVIEMLARYRRLRDEQGFGWGEDALPELFRWARFSLLGPAFDEFAQSGDWAAAVRAAVAEDSPPAGVAVVTVAAGGKLTVRAGATRVGLAGRLRPVDVLLLSAADRDLTVSVAEVAVLVPVRGVELRTVDVDAADPAVRLRCEGIRRHWSRSTGLRGHACGSPRLPARGGRSPTAPAARGSPTACRRSGTSRTSRTGTGGTGRSRSRPVRCTSSPPVDWSSSAPSSTCTSAPARRLRWRGTPSAASTPPPTAGSAATCTCT